MSSTAINSLQSQKAFNYEGIRELKVPLKQAVQETKKNGLDEVFFRAGNKDYVAFGKGMDIKALKGSIPVSFEGKSISITHIDNESNTASEGAKNAFKHIAGKITTGAVALLGAGVGVYGAALGSALGGSAASAGGSALMVGGFVAAGAAVGAGVTAGVGAIAGMAKGTDYESISKIAK